MPRNSPDGRLMGFNPGSNTVLCGSRIFRDRLDARFRGHDGRVAMIVACKSCHSRASGNPETLRRHGDRMVFSLPGFAESQVDPTSAHQRVITRLERHHAVISQSGWPAPDNYVTVRDPHTEDFVSSAQSSKKKDSRNSE